MFERIISYFRKVNQTNENKTSDKSFYLEIADFYHSQILENDEVISLWVKPDETKINFYTNKNGLCGGQGYLGQLPNKYLKEFLVNLSQGAKYECRILEINFSKRNYKINCKYLSPEVVEKERIIQSEKFHTELIEVISKTYKPIKRFYQSRIPIESINGFEELVYKNLDTKNYFSNCKLKVKIEKLEYYKSMKIDYPLVKIVNDNNEFLCNFESDFISLTNIIRAYFSGYYISIRANGHLKFYETIYLNIDILDT